MTIAVECTCTHNHGFINATAHCAKNNALLIKIKVFIDFSAKLKVLKDLKGPPYCKSGIFRENLIFPNSVKRHICHIKKSLL